MNELSTTTASSGVIFNSEMMDKTMAFANEMAKSVVSIPDHLKGKPADCMAIVLVSLQWGMNPYQVAQQTSLINGTLSYGAQLVNSVVSSSTAIVGRFHYEYSDGWERLAGKVAIETVTKTGKSGAYEKTIPVKKWTAKDEEGLWIKVGAIPRGETEIQWSTELYLASVLTRNSPEWITDPQQQISYLGVKKWARKYTPSVLLGVYTPDEMPESPEKDITPKKSQKVSSLRLGPTPAEREAIEESIGVEQSETPITDVAYVDDHEREENLADILFAIKQATNKESMAQAKLLSTEHISRYADDAPELYAAYNARAVELKNASFQAEL